MSELDDYHTGKKKDINMPKIKPEYIDDRY